MKTRLLLGLFALVFFIPSAHAKSDYLYRNRANWVKLIKLSNKQLAGVELKHPATGLTTARIEAMLLSLTMNKGSLFKKEVKTNEIFSIEEAKKFSPFIADALNRAEPNQVVNISLVHQRSYFILKNDFLSMLNVFVSDDGVHFYFTKLFAKLGSDYEQASKMDTAISKAKGVRVSLEAKPGQILAADADEVVMDPQFNFAANVHRTVPAEKEYRVGESEEAPAKEAQKKRSKKAKIAKSAPEEPSDGDVTARLKKLDDLKKQKLITDAEYREKRKEILGTL
jgi:hypothetical protein